MSSFTDYTENLVLNWLLTTNSATRPTAWYVGLFTAAPSDTGGGTEVSGNGYARVATGTISVSGTSPTNATNSAAIDFRRLHWRQYAGLGCVVYRTYHQRRRRAAYSCRRSGRHLDVIRKWLLTA